MNGADLRAGSTAILAAMACAAEGSRTKALQAEGLPAANFVVDFMEVAGSMVAEDFTAEAMEGIVNCPELTT